MISLDELRRIAGAPLAGRPQARMPAVGTAVHTSAGPGPPTGAARANVSGL
jgi:hypothetical protein